MLAKRLGIFQSSNNGQQPMASAGIEPNMNRAGFTIKGKFSEACNKAIVATSVALFEACLAICNKGAIPKSAPSNNTEL